MEYRTLGRTGLSVSAVGVGGGGIGQVWGPTTDEECIRTVQQAYELGVNFFDVAPSYGDGKAEEILGQAARPFRQQVLYATKVRVTPSQRGNIEGAIRESLEASLRRLQTDHVDLLQLHSRVRQERNPDHAGSVSLTHVLGPGGILETMQELRREGKVRFFGFTGYGDYDGVLGVMESGGFDTVQAQYDLLPQSSMGKRPVFVADWPIPSHVIPLAAEFGLGVIGIRALAAGALSEALDRPGDAEKQEDFRKARSLRFLVRSPYRTLSQAAMRFALMNEGIATVVPGVKNVAELEEAVGCLELPPIPAEDLARVDELYARGFTGP